MEKQKSFVYTENLTVGYDGKPLIRDIRLSLEKGQILTLIGPNGAGSWWAAQSGSTIPRWSA